MTFHSFSPNTFPDMPYEAERAKRHVFLFENFLSPEDCEDLINYYDTPEKMNPAVVGSVNNEISTPSRKCLSTHFELMGFHKPLSDFIFAKVQGLNREYLGFEIDHISQGDFLKYEGDINRGESSYYNWHQDVSWHRNADRKLTCILQLSDPKEYEGGDIELTGDLSTSFHPNYKNRGSLFIFNSHIPHRVVPIVKGVRRSIVLWVSGPAWK